MRSFFLILLLCFSIASGVSQTHYDSNVYIGGHAGIDLPRMFFTPAVKQGWPVDPMFGLMFRYIEEDHFGLIAEANWVRRGWSENFEGLPFSYQRNVDFIEVPVFAHIYFGRRAKFFVNAGPQIAFRIGEGYKANFDPYHTSTIPDFPNTNRRNNQMTEPVTQKVDYGISAGLGCEFNVNMRNSVSLEARYYFGLGNLFSSKRQDTFRASNAMYISITAGYWFLFK